LAEKHFGPIPKVPEPPQVVIQPPGQTALKEETLTMAVQLPAVLGGYHIPGAGDEDLPALEVAGIILTAGKSSRLNRSLVREQQLAVAAGGIPLVYKDLGMMLIFAFFTPDKDPQQVKEALLQEIARLKEEPLEERELQKAKNQLTAQYVFNLDSVSGVANAIGEAEVIRGDVRLFVEGAERYEGVTAADVRRVAQRYFAQQNLTLVTLQPGE
jgi:zinc protease